MKSKNLLLVGVLLITSLVSTYAQNISSFASTANPQYLVFDGNGNLYASNYFNGSISKVTASGTVSTYATGLGGYPMGLAFDASGNLYVANQGSNNVIKIAPDGTQTTFFQGLNGPCGLAFDASWNLYVTSGGNVIKITTGGSSSVFASSGLDAPQGLVFDASGNLYVSNAFSNSISKISSNGTVSNYATVGTYPIGLVFDNSGNLYVSSYTGNQIQKISNNGSTVSTVISTNLNSPVGLALDNSGSLYVADFGGANIGKVTFAPSITSTSPSSVGIGYPITIFGSGFTGATGVSIGGVSAGSYTVVNDNTITATVGTGATSGNVVVTTAGGSGTSAGNITITTVKVYAYVTNFNGSSVSMIDVSSKTVVGTISVGTNPIGVCISPDQSKVYVSNQGSNNLSVINTTNNTVAGSITTGTSPVGVCISNDGSTLYVANDNNSSNTVSVINASTNTVTATINVGSGPTSLKLSPDGSKLYVVNASSNSISVINTASNTLINTISIGHYPLDICISPDGSKVFVANGLDNNVMVINTATNTVVTAVNVGADPKGICVSPDGSKLYVANSTGNTVSVIDIASNTVSTTISVGHYPNNVSVSPDGLYVYAVNTNSNSVSVISTSTNSVVSTITVGSSPICYGNFIFNVNILAPNIVSASPSSVGVGGTITITGTGFTGATGITIGGVTAGSFTVVNDNTITVTVPTGASSGSIIVTTAGGVSNAGSITISCYTPYAYVAGNNGNVSVINTNDNSVSSTIAVGGAPQGICISPDATKVYIANTNSVKVINTATNTVSATISAGTYPTHSCITPDGTKLYVVNNGSSNISVINTATNNVIATISIGSNPQNLIASHDGTKVYSLNGDNTINIISTNTNTIIGSATFEGEASDICESPDGSKLYIPNVNAISVINTTSNLEIANINIGQQLTGIAISPDGTRLYVCNYRNSVIVINTSINGIVANIPVGTTPWGISISSDGSKVFVANSNSSTVSVISTASNSVTATITVATGSGALGSFIANVPTSCAVTPAITSISPSSIGVGGVITLTGTGFTGATGITVGGVPAGSYTVVNDNTITVMVPAGASSGSILVTTPAGVSNAGSITIIVAGVSSASPASGGAGSVITFSGTGFTGATGVTIGGVSAGYTVGNGGTSIDVTIPVGAANGNMVITLADGSTIIYNGFTLNIITLSSTGGYVGNNIISIGGVSGITQIIWYNGSTAVSTVLPDANGNIITTFTPATAGSYSAQVTAGSTVYSTTVLAIVAMPKPIVTINWATPANGAHTGGCYNGNSFTFAVSNLDPSYTYSWDFGDGASSSAATATHGYSAIGNFRVHVTVTDGVSTTFADQFIDVYPVPTATYNVLAGTVNGNSYTFISTTTVASGYIASYFWNFGDGTSSTLANPSHLYANTGSYPVSLNIITDQGCSASVSVNQQITLTGNATPITVVNAGQCLNTSGVANDFSFTNTLTQGSGITYSWNFGDGTTDNNSNHYVGVQHSYSAAGTYQVVLTATVNSTSSTYNTSVTVYPMPVPSYNVLAGTVNGQYYTFISSTTIASGYVASYLWNFGDGTTSTLSNPSKLYAASGNYSVGLGVTSDMGCYSSTAQNQGISLNASTSSSGNYTAAFTVNNSSAGCFSNANSFGFTNNSTIATGLTYTWNFGDGSAADYNYTPAAHHYAANGDYTVTLTVWDGTNAPATATQTIHLYPIPTPSYYLLLNTAGVNISNDLHVCFTPGMDFSWITNSTILSGNMNYHWDYGTSNYFDRNGNATTSSNPRIVFNAAGTYPVTLTVTSDLGCSASITHIMYLSEPHALFTTNVDNHGDDTKNPEITFTGTSSYDPGGTITDYAWTYENGTHYNNAASVYGPIHFAKGGTYNNSLVVTSDAGCVSPSVSHAIHFKIRPVGHFTVGTLVYGSNGQPTVTVASNTTTVDETPYDLIYHWSFGDGGTATTNNLTTMPSHTYTVGAASRTVTLSVTNNNEGLVSTDVTQIISPAYIQPVAAIQSSTRDNSDLTILKMNFDASASVLNDGAAGAGMTYDWDFGDNTTHGTGVTCQHTYASGGNHTVTLTVTNTYGGMSTQAQTAFAYYVAPVASFTQSRTGGAGSSLVVGFDGTGSSVNDGGGTLSYDWDFGDNSSHGTGATVSHPYASGGTYHVILVVYNTNNGHITQASYPYTITYYVQPVASVIATLSHDANGYPIVSITNNSSVNESTTLQYSWTYGDGFGTSTSANPSDYTYLTGAASRTINLTVTNPNGGLTDFYQGTINNVYINPVNVTPSVTPTDLGISFSATGTDHSGGTITYTWSFGDDLGGGVSGTATTANAATGSYTYTAAGTYTITITATSSNGGVTTTTTSVTVTAPGLSAIINVQVNNQTNSGWGVIPAGEGGYIYFDGLSSVGNITNYSWSSDYIYTSIYSNTQLDYPFSSNSSSIYFDWLNQNYGAWYYTNQINIQLTVTDINNQTNAASIIYILGNSPNSGNYYTTDNNPAVINNASYFRITNHQLHPLLFPNPVVTTTSIKYSSEIAGTVYIRVYDEAGKLVHTQTATAMGNNIPNTTTMNVGNLMKGIYNVTVTDYTGKKLGITKLVKVN